MVSANRGKYQKGMATKPLGYSGWMPLYAQVFIFRRDVMTGLMEHILDLRMLRVARLPTSTRSGVRKGKEVGFYIRGTRVESSRYKVRAVF